MLLDADGILHQEEVVAWLLGSQLLVDDFERILEATLLSGVEDLADLLLHVFIDLLEQLDGVLVPWAWLQGDGFATFELVVLGWVLGLAAVLGLV